MTREESGLRRRTAICQASLRFDHLFARLQLRYVGTDAGRVLSAKRSPRNLLPSHSPSQNLSDVIG